MLNGLSQISIELTNICEKPHICAMCGHQKDLSTHRGYMEFELLGKIAKQIPEGIIVSFHRSGEPTAYTWLWEALNLFDGYITSLVTHGMNLISKAYEIINNCVIITVSVHKNDPDHDEQLSILREFIELKGSLRPIIQVKIVGDMDSSEYEALEGVRIIRRALHVPQGSHGYVKRQPAIPESGVCLDLLGKPSINWQGDVSICNRFDPKGLGVIGNIKNESLEEIWNGKTRRNILKTHIAGHRELIHACSKCEFWGVPVG